MADILENSGNEQEVERANEAILLTPLELLQQLGQAAWQLVKKGDEWGRAAFKDLEVGNKKLLPETTTLEDLEAVETAVQDPENAKVEVNAIATTEQGEVVRQPVADPWDMEPDQVVDQAMSQLESLEPDAIEVDAVVVEPEQLPSQAQSNHPIVNKFIEQAGQRAKQNASNFVAQANAYLRENIQVDYQPIPQQDGSLALAVDTPSLLTQMQLAGGEYAQAAQEKMRSLAPQQFDRVSQTVKNTQDRMKNALDSATEAVQTRLNQPSMKDRVAALETSTDQIRAAIKAEFATEIMDLQQTVSGLETNVAHLEQQQAKAQEMIAALQSPKPQLSNPRLNQWQSNFVATMKDRFEKIKQNLGERINQAKAKVSELFETFKQKVRERLQPVIDRLKPVYDQAQALKQQAGDQINQVKATVGENVDKAKQFVGEKAMDWQAQALAATATYVLAQQGKQTPHGTTIYEGENFDFHRNVGNSLLIVDKTTQQPVYKNGEFNQKAPQAVKDKLVKAAQTTQQGLEKQQAKEKAQAHKPKPKAVAARR
ncbi:apolipoprotein A1/A4/E family protein [Acaryochloris marina]|uniref:apolipoprotein A1/A4/E family protein n=1 Tax=Acaryochloris marina TaxID=155978 RepID=UPI0021C32797|nr:apolipoprotein A1/A4/E family protein [Acaryochloris marina]BDM83593.1 hypothetical protein AM10699_64540 [Acaryochloris marina MBIC10699]